MNINIQQLIDEINLKPLEDQIIVRKSKINIFDIIYGSLIKIINNYSYDRVVCELNYWYLHNNIEHCEINKSAFISKKNKINADKILNYNNNLLNNFSSVAGVINLE